MDDILSMEQRFLDKVDKSGDCWMWTGSKYSDGYGKMSVGPRHARKAFGAHRISKMLEIGRVLRSDELVCHSCDNPVCVNPSHLWVGTTSDNQRDMASKGRSTHGEKSGRAKWSNQEVDEIRARHAAGERQVDLRKEYGMSKSNMSYIVNKKTFNK